jgi:hypothetical protein
LLHRYRDDATFAEFVTRVQNLRKSGFKGENQTDTMRGLIADFPLLAKL